MEDHDVQFNGAGQDDLPSIAQAWSIDHLDAGKRAQNWKTIEGIAAIIEAARASTTLRTLSLANNRLRSLPESVRTAARLTWVVLSSNPLLDDDGRRKRRTRDAHRRAAAAELPARQRHEKLPRDTICA